MGQNQSTSSGGGNLKCHQEQNKSQPLDARADKIKDKVSCFFKNKYIMNQYIKEIFSKSSHQNVWINFLLPTPFLEMFIFYSIMLIRLDILDN